VVCFLQSDLQGLHCISNSTAVAESGSGALIRGGGCEGKDRWSWCNISDCSGSGCVVRGMISQRPSVVGKQTSSIWIVASFSSTARGVRPGANAVSRCFRVTERA